MAISSFLSFNGNKFESIESDEKSVETSKGEEGKGISTGGAMRHGQAHQRGEKGTTKLYKK